MKIAAVSLVTLVAVTLGSTVALHAQRAAVSPPEGASWAAWAERYLEHPDGTPFSAATDHANLRCVRMNNFGCLWQRGATWPHTPGVGGANGAHDGAGGTKLNTGHAIFDDGHWSIVAFYLWLASRTNNGEHSRSAVELTAIYSPWCDTHGSAATRKDATGRAWGRGCDDNGARPSRDFKGPMCSFPAHLKPAPHQCEACNCPDGAARGWTRGMNIGIGDQLTLFDAADHPTAQADALIANAVVSENGHYRPNARAFHDAAADYATYLAGGGR